MKRALRLAAKGAVFPEDNDSAFLLDVHRRAVPTERMARYADDDEVDLAIVGAGAGGSVLAQRLARAGWRVVVLESGPFWDPDRDWVSDEAGQHKIYWTAPRVIGGEDPVELGKNNSGHGVGGSMVHYAGYTPRFHPSGLRDVHARRRRRRLADRLCGPQGALRARRARAAGGRAGLAVGRPARLPACRPPALGRLRARARGRPPGGDRDARRPGGDPQRHVRQPAALHLPRLLPAGLQGQREGQPADHPPARRHRPRRRGARRQPRLLRGDRRGRRPGHRRGLRARRGSGGASARGPSRSAATRSRPRACCCCRARSAGRRGWATATTRSGAT